MNNKKILLVIVLAFVLVLGGAYVLYERLGQNVETDRLAVNVQTAADAPAAEATGEPESEATAAPATAGPEADADETPESDAAETEAPEAQVIYAPDFTVYDADGNEVMLSDFFGKPIVLNFWASWCGPCRSEMPDFNDKYKEIGDEVNFVMINMTDGGRETVETASEFIAENGYEFPVLFDTESDAARTYGAYSLPTSYFINAEGHVIARASGAIDAATLQKGIELISE